MNHRVVVTTIVEIDSRPVMFTVAGETDRDPYRLARRLSETNNGDVYDWVVDQPREVREAWKASETASKPAEPDKDLDVWIVDEPAISAHSLDTVTNP